MLAIGSLVPVVPPSQSDETASASKTSSWSSFIPKTQKIVSREQMGNFSLAIKYNWYTYHLPRFALRPL
jgi:hypothetical protein